MITINRSQLKESLNKKKKCRASNVREISILRGALLNLAILIRCRLRYLHTQRSGVEGRCTQPAIDQSDSSFAQLFLEKKFHLLPVVHFLQEMGNYGRRRLMIELADLRRGN